MPDISGPFDSVSFGRPCCRDRATIEPSGVYGRLPASASAGDLGLSLSGLTSTVALGRGMWRARRSSGRRPPTATCTRRTAT